MFFLAVCARGHVTNVARCVRRSVFRPIPASWRQQQTGVCVRVDRKLLQRLKNRISSVAHWCSYTQSHTHIPNLTTPEVRGHALKGPTESVTRSCHRRGHERTRSNDNRFKFYPTDPSFSSPSHLLLGLRLIPVSSGVSPGWRGLCSGKPRETPADCPTGEDQRETTQPADRLPDPGQGLFKFKELYENPWTIPNLLCVCRIALAPVLGVLITEQHFHLSLGLFALAGFTDVLDGYIARNWASQKSALGSALDPLADKILISVLYISLTYAQLIPAPLTALVIARDVGLIAAVFYVRYKTVPPPVTLNKFFNPCYTTAQLKPTTISKVNTAIQLFLVAASLASPVFHYTDSPLLQALWYITAVTTTVSGYSYYHYGMKTVAVLNSTK
ncbi:cardiolipin synthase (CMP-forming) isoform X2 [Coregonus clupeaformis]|uniref:cardiolipin synthase (CMP-forming) isoform X2 n=1 Tax=Coregonus clupeaformis TaxID=59861 RepID=UPI001BE05FB8|nr:cardiolipin synthase (CMP-forming) isoform X2 [Coregonus clupeaformis]